MKIIESTQNELIKKYSKLLQKKYRDEEKLFIIEGRKNAYDSLRALPYGELEAILICHGELSNLLNKFPNLEEKIIVTEEKILAKVSDYSSNSQIIVVAKQRDYTKNITNKLCLYLDRIRDPGNLGTIIRSAAAAGYGVILDNCCDLFNPKVIRGCMSAICAVEIVYSSTETLKKYKANGYRVIAADASGKSIFEIKEHSISSPLIIAIGNEAEGLSDAVLKLCDESVAIPIEHIESLNAALAAGVLMFEFKYRIIV